MSFLGRPFGGGKPEQEPHVRQPSLPELPPPQDPTQDPDMVRVYDAYGRELFITPEEWRTSVLPGTIQANWNKPDELYNIIVRSLNDGFRAEVLGAAEQLYKTDPQRVRSASVWGIVLMEEGRLDEAEQIFRDFVARHGEDGVILTNLAKVHSRRKDDTQAEGVLRRGLQLDPNQENGMAWYVAIHRERGGDAAGEQALRLIAAIPRSWRAQLWLARDALQRRDLAEALKIYEQSLASAGAPVPADLLMQMSCDLGNAGHLPELVNLTLPRFDVAAHGLQVGSHLIKAMLDLGHTEPARRTLQQLYGQNRPDWKQTLGFWDTELAKLCVATHAAEPVTKLSVAMLTVAGPIWLPEQSPAHELFPPASSAAARICFLGSSAETGHEGDTVKRQLSDGPGRLSRALPLFLAEQVRFHSHAEVLTLVPWIPSESGGFMLIGTAWADADAVQYAKAGEVACDHVIVTHLRTNAEPWMVELRLIRTIDAKRLATTEASFPSGQPAEAAKGIARELLSALARHADVTLTSTDRHYSVPTVVDVPCYLLRLEQLLAVRCSGIGGFDRTFLSGEREIIDGNIHLCLNNTKNTTTRILLLQTMMAMKRVRPGIVGEFREKLERLQREHSLDEPARGVCERMLGQVLAV